MSPSYKKSSHPGLEEIHLALIKDLPSTSDLHFTILMRTLVSLLDYLSSTWLKDVIFTSLCASLSCMVQQTDLR